MCPSLAAYLSFTSNGWFAASALKDASGAASYPRGCGFTVGPEAPGHRGPGVEGVQVVGEVEKQKDQE